MVGGKKSGVWNGKYPFIVHIRFNQDDDEYDYDVGNRGFEYEYESGISADASAGVILSAKNIVTAAYCMKNASKLDKVSLEFGHFKLDRGYKLKNDKFWSIKRKQDNDSRVDGLYMIQVEHRPTKSGLDLRIEGRRNTNKICLGKNKTISLSESAKFMAPYYDTRKKVMRELELHVVMCPRKIRLGICAMAFTADDFETGNNRTTTNNTRLPCGTPLVREQDNKWHLYGVRSKASDTNGKPIELGSNVFYFYPVDKLKVNK